MANSDPPVGQALSAMLDALKGYLPPPAPPLPDPGVSVVSMQQRGVGLGNRRGIETRGPFPVVELKGIRLDAMVRFQLWATGPASVDNAMADLNARLMTDQDTLWTTGFLRMALEAAPPAEAVPALNAWRKHAEYRVLFEYSYTDSDDAASLIARIPIAINSQFGESTVVTDEMTRWDNLAAPALEVRGSFGVAGLSILAFVPGGAPTGSVTLTRTFAGAVGPPVSHPSLAAFLAAVAGPSAPERHASVTFASFSSFLAGFSPAGDPVFLGDWDLNGVADQYNPLTLSITPAIRLPEVTDRFVVTYQVPPLDQVAVVYLRATRGT